MVKNSVWKAAGMAAEKPDTRSGFLCIGCLEKRLGRNLTPADFTPCLLNEWSPWDTARLASRKGTG